MKTEKKQVSFESPQAYAALQYFRQAGYRSTGTAVAELVDNSIEANASRIDIIAVSRGVLLPGRKSNQVEKIAVLDNGNGMAKEILVQCLSLGWGTHLDSRSGMGRFGFGLKGSSLSQARRVEVYSWTSPGKVYRAYLDLDEVKDKKLDELPAVEQCELPDEISRCFADRVGDSGTLVLWSELDQMDLKRAETLLGRINEELCRIYRHFLDDRNEYGKQRAISLHTLRAEDMGLAESVQLKANDPLYRLVPNNLPDYGEEATNEIHCEPFTLDFEYDRGGEVRTSPVEFRFTIAKPAIQNLGGNSVQGSHYSKNAGISFVRAGREIDFGGFGFMGASEPRHRWWGAEVRFKPELDELFGIANTKQHVVAVRKLDPDVLRSMADDDTGDDYRGKLVIEVNRVLSERISEMMRIIKAR